MGSIIINYKKPKTSYSAWRKGYATKKSQCKVTSNIINPDEVCYYRHLTIKLNNGVVIDADETYSEEGYFYELLKGD